MDVDVANGAIGTAPQPHDIIWYSDGDVVLATDVFLFKVHKLILPVSLQSSVFRDMFAFPAVDGVRACMDGDSTRAGVHDMYEGIPMVVLNGDKGEEVVHLLRTVYERDYYYRDDNDTPLEMITALLVLSTKYDFRLIRHDVIRQVLLQYPMTLDGYVFVNVDNAKMFGRNRKDCHFPLLDAILKADVECLLPVLYYACSDFDMIPILRESNRLSLDPQSVQILVNGRDVIKNTTNQLIAKLPDKLREHAEQYCTTLETGCCAVAYFSNLNTFCNSTDLGKMDGKSIASCLHQACESCKAFIATSIDKRRERIWDALPSVFHCRGLRWTALEEELARLPPA